MEAVVSQLSCQQCQRRKTKCDKQLPICSACVKAGIACTLVQRQRLPRGRTAKKNSHRKDLKTRIERLEAALLELKQPSSASEPRSTAPQDSPSSSAFSAATPVTSFIAADFWEELTGTIAGMREVLESPDADDQCGTEDDHDATLESAGSTEGVLSHGILFPFVQNSATEASLRRPEIEQFLIHTYQYRVDSIFKVLHWPSTIATLQHGNENSGEAETAALKSAMCFTALSSLSDHEFADRLVVLSQYRQLVETAFANVDLLTSPTVQSLQAFVIYLAGLRACQANALQWTLTATAIRLAGALGMPERSPNIPITHEGQLRRRLWCSIGLLDMQSAFDRGSKPLLTSGDFDELPVDINDKDLSHHPVMPPAGKEKFTEMSFSLLVYSAGICQRKLTELGLSAAYGTMDPDVTAKEQRSVLSEFERRVTGIGHLYDPGSPIQAFTKAVGEGSLVAMRLLLHRPLHRRGFYRPRVAFETNSDEIDVLATATEVLESSQFKRTQAQFSQWAWFSWVKWYALAIVLAELCTARGSHADYAWSLARQAYEDYANIVADAKSGLLWRPIAKLMARVKQLRAERDVVPVTQPQPEISEVIGRPSHTNSNTSTDTFSTSYPYDEQIPHAADYAQVTLYTDQLPASDNMSWYHWDMLIDDINDPALFITEELPAI